MVTLLQTPQYGLGCCPSFTDKLTVCFASSWTAQNETGRRVAPPAGAVHAASGRGVPTKLAVLVQPATLASKLQHRVGLFAIDTRNAGNLGRDRGIA